MERDIISEITKQTFYIEKPSELAEIISEILEGKPRKLDLTDFIPQINNIVKYRYKSSDFDERLKFILNDRL